MNTINVENCKTLLIGRRGENEVTTVAFDFTEWATEFGSGVVDLYVKRFGDDSAYPVVLTIDGTVASWLVTETDTNVAGYGKAEYVYRVDGKIAKSAVFPFFVAEDIGQPASEPPDPYESWLEQLTALGAETEANAQAAEQSAENAAESAQEAAGSATSAEGYAGQAETAAWLAQAAQTASEAARDAAQTAQASAEASATAASGSAASAASSATAAAGSASDASASASAAGASATAASASATTASNAATAAQTAQSAAEDAAEDAQQAAQQAHVEYEQLSGEVDDLSDEVAQQKSAFEAHEQYAEETYAKQDGTYEDLTAGNAYELLSDRGDTNAQPYLFRQTGGDSSAYNREQLKKIVGGTVAWNQLSVQRPTEGTQSGVTITPNDDGGVTLNGTLQSSGAITAFVSFAVFENHKYFIHPYGSAFDAGASVYTNIGGNIAGLDLIRASNSTSTDATVTLRASADTTFTNARAFITTVDLTQMFGTAIADYLYSLEQANAGAGVAFFRSLFPADYYDYNPGELMSVEGVSAHETVGFNLVDLTRFAEMYPEMCSMTGNELNCYSYAPFFTTGIPVDDLDLSGGYCTVELKTGTATNVRLRLMYENGQYQELGGTNSQSYVKYSAAFNRQSKLIAVRLNWTQSGSFYVRNLCINRSDPARNGTYEPYKKRTYPLDSSLTLRGIPKLDSNNALYYNGDTYESDGTVVRKYGVVDLGTLNWVKSSVDGSYNSATAIGAALSKPVMCNKYVADSGAAQCTKDKTIWVTNGNGYVYIMDTAYTVDAAAFKAAMSGVMLVYELATPTAETAEPYRELEICDRDGTEEFVSTSIVPVGHETFYPVNVFDYIDRLTEPDADMIADSAIAANKYFSVGNRLFLSTASIAAGAMIIPGTNCQETSLAAALNALNA